MLRGSWRWLDRGLFFSAGKTKWSYHPGNSHFGYFWSIGAIDVVDVTVAASDICDLSRRFPLPFRPCARPTSRILPPAVAQSREVSSRCGYREVFSRTTVLGNSPWDLPWPLWHLSESCIKMKIHLVRAYVVRRRRSVLQMDGFNKRSGTNDRVRRSRSAE